MDFSQNILDTLEPEMARSLIPGWLCGFMELETAEMEAAVKGVASSLSCFDDAAFARSLAYLRTLGDEYTLYRADPVARKATRAYMRVLMSGSEVSGIENLRAAQEAGPTLLLCNHLAYCDTQIKDVLLADSGADDLADKLIVVAGPKVYEDSFRRMASMGLNTLKTAQSAALSHNEKKMGPREIAAIALGTVRLAHHHMNRDQMVLVYGEGSRSRTRRLGPFIKAVRKYVQVEGCQIVPLAISGSQQMMPLGRPTMSAVPVQLRIGQPIEVEGLGALAAMEAAWHSIADMLPDDQKPDEGVEPVV